MVYPERRSVVGMALMYALLVLLWITAEIKGYCHLTKASLTKVRLPVYCEKGEYCCGSGKYRHCCNEDYSNLSVNYAPAKSGDSS